MTTALAPAGAAVVEATGLAKAYDPPGGRIEVLVDVSLSVDAGEVVALTGPSGSGKSTLLGLLAGFEAPDRGEVRWGATDGTPVRRSRSGAPAWATVAVVPQALGLLEELPVAEAVALPLRLQGAGRREQRDRVAEVLDALGLGHLAGRLPAQLSLGEQQRVALARALVAAPRLAILDEPTAHQDPAATERILDLVRVRAAAGTAVLISTHDAALVEACDRRLVLRAGRIDVDKG